MRFPQNHTTKQTPLVSPTQCTSKSIHKYISHTHTDSRQSQTHTQVHKHNTLYIHNIILTILVAAKYFKRASSHKHKQNCEHHFLR